MPLDLKSHSIDPSDPSLRDALEDLQGNILKSHGRDHASHIFLRFPQGKEDDLKRWISQFAQSITSAYKQLEDLVAWRQSKIDGGLFVHFALSASGYRKLGFVEESAQPKGSNPQGREKEQNPTDFYVDVFPKGMKFRQEALQDPPFKEWETQYQKDIDAIIILADDNPLLIISKKQEITQQLQEITQQIESTPDEQQQSEQQQSIDEIIHVEEGFVLRQDFSVSVGKETRQFSAVVEHFGYADGISQPLFLKDDLEKNKSRVGDTHWNPAAALDLVLVKDPHGKSNDSFGSFLVFRKLEQNVQGFRRAEQTLARELDTSTDLAGAMAVGRFKDGSPLVLSEETGNWIQDPAEPTRFNAPNDFEYRNNDSQGLKCPFQAHIRKSNPRKESVGAEGPFAKDDSEELGHRIVRRGIPYGGELKTSNDLTELPTGGVGLLFMCYQADICEQFEFIQRFWCNNPVFLEPRFSEGTPNKNKDYDKTGLDAVIGQSQDSPDPEIGEIPLPPKNWIKDWGNTIQSLNLEKEEEFGQFVTLKGGEYFFSPSISFLKNLDSGQKKVEL
jgi:Dyp-type peroxidase family